MKWVNLSLVLWLSFGCGDDDTVFGDASLDARLDAKGDAGQQQEDLGVDSTNDSSLVDGDLPDALVVQDAAPDAALPQIEFDDEFSTDTLSMWQRRHQVERTSAQYSRLDVNSTVSGALVIEPSRTPGWFAADDAPLLFKNVTGNFAVETSVEAQSVSDPGQVPGDDFNSAGLMVRNPNGASGPENYVMVNVGRQDTRAGATGVGSEAKTTVNSSSTLTIDEGPASGSLILCRVGTTVSAFRRLTGESTWTRIARYDRSDLPDLVQVGMVANGFRGPDLRATFDYIRLRVPADEAECTP